MDTAVLDNLSTPALLVGDAGRIRYGNAAAGLFWRLPEQRLGEFTLARLFGTDNAVAAAVGRALEHDAPSLIEGHRFEQGEGLPPLLLRVQVEPMPAADGAGPAALVLFWDETQRDLLEAEAREARVMEAVALVVRRLAHELRNPLSGVKGATQLLARRLSDVPDLAAYPRVILRELERLERLVRSLLAYGAEPPLARSAFNLHELLDEVIWFETNSGTGVRFERAYDPSLPPLYADRDRMHQVFLNLIRNAVDASPEGGLVRVRTAMEGPWGAAGARPHPSRPAFRIEVGDAGPGLSAEAETRLFTPFFTTKKHGTGLGLAICHQIVRAHEGALRYRRAPGGGAVFTVLIPLQEPADVL